MEKRVTIYFRSEDELEIYEKIRKESEARNLSFSRALFRRIQEVDKALERARLTFKDVKRMKAQIREKDSLTNRYVLELKAHVQDLQKTVDSLTRENELLAQQIQSLKQGSVHPGDSPEIARKRGAFLEVLSRLSPQVIEEVYARTWPILQAFLARAPGVVAYLRERNLITEDEARRLN
ncbi:MAG: hypothetical protein JRJ26_09750 [Deltaproteobacteria bacterium]|nr:hypothetical protein [Deltaproteobacteria bacterium]